MFMKNAAKIIGVITGTLTLSQIAVAGHLNIVLEAYLDGRAEVATGASNNRIVGDPDGRGGIYVFGIDNDTQTLCYVLEVDGILQEGLMAHIHMGEAGENGPVIANLAGPVGGDAADCLSEGEPGKFNLQVLGGTDAGIVQAILQNPEGYYVNVHNADYPSGAIRGQLHALHE